MKIIKIFLGCMVVIIAVIVVIIYIDIHVPPSDLNSLTEKAKYPKSTYWKTSYQSGGVDGIPSIRACFDTTDSKDSVLNYYQSHFSQLGWQVIKTDTSATDESVHTGNFGLNIDSQDHRFTGVIGEYDQSMCKYFLDLLKK